MHWGIQQRNKLQQSVILKIFLGNFYSTLSYLESRFEKWLQLFANKSYLFPEIKKILPVNYNLSGSSTLSSN